MLCIHIKSVILSNSKKTIKSTKYSLASDLKKTKLLVKALTVMKSAV